MLEKIDLSRKIGKKAYKRQIRELQDHLYATQKASWDARIPVIILFEGWDAAGKGTSIQTLTSRLDPRGFKLYPIRAPRTYEKKHPWLWRFWLKLPGQGEWAIFDRSWYGRVLVERVERLIPENEWRIAYRDIVDFERALADDGYLIIKFFLHISREEQRRRFEKLSQDPLNAWHVAPEDWEHHRQYDEWSLAYEEMFERTETEWGPWTIVEATNRRFTQVKIYQTIIATLEERLAALGNMPDEALWKATSIEESPAEPAETVEASLHQAETERAEEATAPSQATVLPEAVPPPESQKMALHTKSGLPASREAESHAAPAEQSSAAEMPANPPEQGDAAQVTGESAEQVGAAAVLPTETAVE